MNSLPLSWSVVKNKKCDPTVIDKWNLKWYTLFNSTYSDYNNFLNQSGDKNSSIIIRGCNSKLEHTLSNFGFTSIQFGMEAILKTSQDHFNKKSLKELIKRGNRHGKIEEVEFSAKNKAKLNDFKNCTVHANEPQLKNLFQTEFKEHNLLYVFKKFNNYWLGAILISKNGPEKLHTELILRNLDAPIGIMEALIHHAFYEAKKSGWKELSLGEVPFRIEKTLLNPMLAALKTAGKIINFAYNHIGLYNFKNKFQPKWETLYICSSSKIKVKHILFILFYSNFYNLVSYKLIYALKKYSLQIFNKKFRIFIPKQLDFNKT